MTLADIRGVILGRTCNGQKAVLLFRFLFYCMYWLRDSGRNEFCRSAGRIAATNTVAVPGTASVPQTCRVVHKW